jgi:hypothetical protein
VPIFDPSSVWCLLYLMRREQSAAADESDIKKAATETRCSRQEKDAHPTE